MSASQANIHFLAILWLIRTEEKIHNLYSEAKLLVLLLFCPNNFLNANSILHKQIIFKRNGSQICIFLFSYYFLKSLIYNCVP